MAGEPIRIQKYLSQKGVCSRREAESYIRAGRLKVDGKKAELGDRVSDGMKILLDGKALLVPETVDQVVLVFYKPLGVETTLAPSPEGNKTLLDFDFKVGRVFPVGRLDKNSHGLLLLTNDGALAHQLMHPSFEKTKEYLVRLNKDILKKDITKLSRGVKVGDTLTAPCQIEPVNPDTIKMTLVEGRNRQIRRMCGAVGYEVLDLFRGKFGTIELADLKPGEWRSLSESERQVLASTQAPPVAAPKSK